MTTKTRRSGIVMIASLMMLAASAGIARAEGSLSWWCYNGTCCKMSGDGSVSRECNFGCSLEDGQQLAPSVLMGCPGYEE